MLSNSHLKFAAVGFAVLIGSAIPDVVNATHAWGTYHWGRTTNPFTLQLGDNLSTEPNWKDHLANTSAKWNASTVLKTMVVTGKANRNCSGVAGTTQVCNKRYGNNGWLGLAQIWLSGGHITQGTAKVNDTYFSTSKYNNPNEKLHVMCQEVAHTFGLGHTSTDGSSQNTCMDYYSNTGGNAESTLSTAPNTHDFEQLGTIYTHTDTTNTVAPSTASTAAGAAIPGLPVADDPKSWGQLVRQSPNGRSSYYETSNKGGIKILTHVTWTEEAAARCRSCDHRFHATE